MSPPPPPPIDIIPSIIFFIISSMSPPPPPPIDIIPPGPPLEDVVVEDEDMLEDEKVLELENDPSSLLVDVAIICEADEESCLTAVLPSSVVKALEAADMASETSAPSGALILRGA